MIGGTGRRATAAGLALAHVALVGPAWADATLTVGKASPTHFDDQVMAREYDLVIGMYTKDCRFDGDSLASLKRSFTELKLLDQEPDMAGLYTERFLPK